MLKPGFLGIFETKQREGKESSHTERYGSSKKGDSKKGDKKSDKGGNFDVKDEDDEPGFGPLIDG